MTVNRFRTTLVAVCLTLAVAASASAQVFGTFNFQMQPFCNVVTMTITQIPTGYTLDGFDDQCAALKRASLVGMATLNPDGTVGVTFTIVTAPAGKGVHVSAVISPVTGSGTWTDSVANTGTFVLAGAVPGLPQRPVSTSGVGPATITTVEIAPAAVGATQLAANAVTGASVVDGSLAMADIANGPRAAFTGASGVISVPSAGVVVRTVTLVAPGPGKIIVNGAGTFLFPDTAAGVEYVRCSITQGTTLDFSDFIFGTDGGSTNSESADAFGITRGFDVTAGSFSANLFCNRLTGAVNSQVFQAALTAIFVAP